MSNDSDLDAALPLRRSPDVIMALLRPAGLRVVDVGCGEGGMARLLATAGATVTGIEPQADLVARARRADPEGLVVWLAGGGEALPLANGAADAVLYFNSLHHLPPDSMAPALREAARVLAPAGRLLVVEPLARGAHFELVRRIEDESVVRALALAAIRAAAGGDFRQLREEFWRVRLRYTGFGEFRRRLLTVDPARAAALDAAGPDLEREFMETALREEAPDGRRYGFDQPLRANLLQRA